MGALRPGSPPISSAAIPDGTITVDDIAPGTNGYILRTASGAVAWRELSATGLLADRPSAASGREGQTYWVTDAAAGLELSECVHQGASYAWVVRPYGVTATGALLVQAANAAAARTALGLGTLATQNGTFSGTSSGTNTGDQTLTSLGVSAFVQTLLTDANAAAVRTTIDAQEDVMTANGDLVTRSGGATARLPIGTALQQLRVNAGATALEWAAGGSSPTTTRGELIRRGASADEAFAAQTADTFVGGDGTDVVSRTAAQARTSLLTSPTGVGTLGERGAFTSGGLPASTADHILLVNSNTTDGSTSIVDTSPLAATITRAGSPLPVHGQERFFLGSTTLRFGGGYGTLPANAAYAIGTGDFCMRAWINRHAAEADRRILSMGQVTSNDGGWVWGVGSDATKMNFAVRSGGAITDYTTPAVDRYYRTGDWVQVELTRASGVLYFFVAGVLVYSTASVLSVGTAALTLYLGWSAHTSTAWNGWLQGVELLSVAGHTATYTP